MATITRANITAIRNDVEAALKAIYAKHGVDVTVGRITFNATSFRCKIEGIVRVPGATAAVTPKAAALASNAKFLLPASFDETKSYRSDTLGVIQVVGYNVKAKKYPFIVKQVRTGKQYKVTASAAKAYVTAGAV